MIPEKYQQTIDHVHQQLQKLLTENLYSCILYGSTVRDTVVPGQSDINLLIILNESTPDAHAAIAECLDAPIEIDPFIIGRRGMERSFQVFALKFRSIKRHYRVLSGVDPIKGFNIPVERVRFLCEQGIRNLRLRSVHNFIKLRHDPRRYYFYINNLHTIIFTYVSEILRIEDQNVAVDFSSRVKQIETCLKIDASILSKLDEIHRNRTRLTQQDIPELHRKIFSFLHNTVQWMEAAWPTAL